MFRLKPTSAAFAFTASFCRLLFLTVCHIFFAPVSNAQGDLLITPKRVVLDGSKRSMDINLANSGKDSATYVISFIQIRMTENGSFETIETPDSAQLFAEPFLRIFPRQVTLGPSESQTVKVQVRRSNEMKEGEYRSHLYFRAVPRERPLGESKGKGDSSIAVRLTPIYGISIPVILKVGASDARVELADVALSIDKEKGPMTKIAIQRSGNMSVYGDLVVNHISNEGKITKVGIARGFAVYTPNAVRKFDLVLDKAAPVNYNAGKLQVVYTDQSIKPVVLAQKEISLH